MRVESKSNKRSIPFGDIREGTAFVKGGGETYIKGSSGAALDVKTGQITYPANDANGGWEECYIYPRASLSLG